MQEPAARDQGFATQRVEALADGIFGIAMTLLVLAEHGTRAFGVAVYCANLVLISAAFYLQWAYATNGHRLVDATLAPSVVRDVQRRLVHSTVLMVAALAGSLWHPVLAFAAYLLIQAAYIARTARTPTGVPPQ